MLPPMWIMTLLHFQVGLNLHVIPKPARRELDGPNNYCLLLKMKHLEQVWTSQPTPTFPKGKSLGAHMVGWKISSSPDNPPLWLGGS